MLKLLIVDDEKRTRDGLKKCIPWKACGIGEIRDADDGSTALEILSHYTPDIIVSDVRMPTMTGIELAQAVRKRLPACKFIFISGYSDKDDLKAAIRLNAVSYIEKPISIAELEACIRDVAALSRQEQDRSMLEAAAAAKLKASVTLLQRNIAVYLAENTPAHTNIGHLLELSGHVLPVHDNYVSAIMHIETSPSASGEPATAEYEALEHQLAHLLKNEAAPFVTGMKDHAHLLVHVCLSGSMNRGRLKWLMSHLGSPDLQMSARYGGKLCIGIGSEVKGIVNLPAACQSAWQALQKARFFGAPRMIMNEADETNILELETTVEQTFAACIARCDTEAFAVIDALLTRIRRQDAVRIDSVKDLIHKLLQKLYDEARRRFLARFLNRAEDILWWQIVGASTLEELLHLLTSETREYFDALRELSAGSRAVRETMHYIHRNYKKGNFTIYDIANELSLTPAYLSQLFKRDTGQTINDYVTSYKINKAKALLKNRGVKLLSVASETGFNDVKYFTKTFKRITGMTPSEYREHVSE